MAFPTLIVINGTLKKVDGTPEKGHIVFQAPVSALSSTDSTVVVPSYRVATLDENGTFSIALPASNDPSWNPGNWTYRVIEQLSSGKREFRTIVPYDALGGQYDYTNLVPAIDVDAQLYALYNHTHPGGGGDSVDWADIVGKPSTFPPSTHNHDDRYYTESEILALFAAVDYPVDSVNGKTGVVVINKSDVGLGNVDNTSDTSKPVSTATQTALNGKENAGVAASLVSAHSSDTTDVHGIADTTVLVSDSDLATALGAIDYPVDSVAGKTGAVTLVKGDVGLGNVDNTSDLNKPISTATQTALNGKANTSHTHTESDVTNLVSDLSDLDSRVSDLEAGGGGGASATIVRGYVTSGDFTGTDTSGAWEIVSSSPSFVIAAAIGDHVEIEVDCLLDMNNSLTDWFEIGVVNGASIVRYASTDNSSPAGAGEGDPSIYPVAGGRFRGSTIRQDLIVTSGDLNGGNVTFKFLHKGPATGKVFAGTDRPLRYRIRNDH